MCSPEVTVTSLRPPRLCRLAVFSIKPTLVTKFVIVSVIVLLFCNLLRMCRFAIFYYRPTLSHVDLTFAFSWASLPAFLSTSCGQIFPLFVTFVRFTHETQDRLRRIGSWPCTLAWSLGSRPRRASSPPQAPRETTKQVHDQQDPRLNLPILWRGAYFET